MRVLKFRAWDGLRMTTSGIMFSTSTGQVFSAASMPIMQYTGLLDKNGKELYDGDVVAEKYLGKGWDYESVNREVKWGSYDDGEYVSDVQCWMIGHRSLSDSVDNKEWSIEIIGNIYESPTAL